MIRFKTVISFLAIVCFGIPSFAPADETLRLPLRFNAPAKGFVSVALFYRDGVPARSLLYAEPVEEGAHQ